MLDIANLSTGVILLLLRVAVVFLLYFFLWQVLQIVARDLRVGQVQPTTNSPYGQLILVNAGLTGLAVGKAFPLAPVTVMGRSTDSDIALNDSFLSGAHARLELRGDEWLLEDLGSTNGTFVNGFEVRDPTSVNIGDVIRIGRIELRLVI